VRRGCRGGEKKREEGRGGHERGGEEMNDPPQKKNFELATGLLGLVI